MGILKVDVFQIQPPGRNTDAAAGYDDWTWRDATIWCLLTNLFVLQEELVKSEHQGRKDQVLMEAVGEVLQQMMWESVAAKVGGPE